MTDYQRTTTRETQVVDSGVPAEPVPPVDASDAPPPVVTNVRTTESAHVPAGPGAANTASRIVVFAFGILQVALILRIILLLLVANPGNDVVALILNLTDPFVEPFRGMFSIDRVTADQGSKFDVAALVALVAWTLVEALILAALRIFDRRPTAAV